MANRELTTEEALALLQGAAPKPTNAGLGNQLFESFGRGARGSTVGLVDALTSAETYKPLIQPETYTQLGKYVYEQPLQAIESGARTIGRGALGTAGALVSAPVGAAMGLRTGAPLTGALTAGATGGAAGGLLFDKIAQAIGVDPQTTAEEDVKKLAEETGAFVSGDLFMRGTGKALKSVSNKLIPGVAENQKDVAAQIAAGNELKAQGINSYELDGLIEQKNELAATNPAMRNLTTAELTDNQNLAILEDQLQKGPATTIATTNKKMAAMKEADQLVTNLADFARVNPAERGNKIRSEFRTRRKAAIEKASEPFKGPLQKIDISVGGLTSEIDDALSPWMQEGKAPLNKEVASVVSEIKSIAEPAPIVKTTTTGAIPEYGVAGVTTAETIGSGLPQASVGSLHNLRSRMLKLARTSKQKDVKAQALDVADVITKRIERGLEVEGVLKDNPTLKAEWQLGNEQYRSTMDLYYRSPLAKAMNKANPEDVIKALKKSEVINNFQDVFGNLTSESITGPRRDLLAGVLKKYTTLKTPESKIKFLEDNRTLFENTGVWPSLRNALDYYQKTTGVTGMIPKGATGKSISLSEAAQKGIAAQEYAPKTTGPLTKLILGTTTLGTIPYVLDKVAKSKAAQLTQQSSRIGQELSKAMTPEYASKLIKLANVADQKAAFKKGYSPYALMSSALNAARTSEEPQMQPVTQQRELTTEEALALLGQ